MRALLSVTLGAWIAFAAAASAEELPAGTFASIPEGCASLKDKTQAELEEDLDFYVLTREGIVAYKQRCDFVQVTPQKEGRWLATAFCEEDGYVYPDVFAIARTDTGGLAVTRVTDLTQQETDEGPAFAEDDMDPVELDHDPAESEGELEIEPEPEPEQTDAMPKPDAFNQFVLCPDVKP